ncbi:gamma-glutamylcyclotransferase [Ambystoma mexicanum]|uniref:gamma-glutamylcyclotransferase n=1 Tax=Ambystoma mexicanum TaxID=8296 RepID=UPI0037E7B729
MHVVFTLTLVTGIAAFAEVMKMGGNTSSHPARAGVRPGEATFLYCAYGSNLLRERILLRNPSATFYSTGRLQDYKLAFGNRRGRENGRWHGGSATILLSPGEEMWGVVWKMNVKNLASLDKQEGVMSGVYVPIEITVTTEAGEELTCRSYQLNDYVPSLPSPQYKQVICMGAKQNLLPAEYQNKLEAIETNNYEGPLPIMQEIEAAMKNVQQTMS